LAKDAIHAFNQLFLFDLFFSPPPPTAAIANAVASAVPTRLD
jgi:hypothetical protein